MGSERTYHGYTLEDLESNYLWGYEADGDVARALIARIRELEADLAAVKRKADACDLWRAEALAAEPVTVGGSRSTCDYKAINDARRARINAGLQ